MAALLFISFIVLLLIGVPVAFAIAAAALLVLLKGDVKLLILVQRMFASTDSFSLIAVPFFIFAGDLLAKGKVSKVLSNVMDNLEDQWHTVLVTTVVLVQWVEHHSHHAFSKVKHYLDKWVATVSLFKT